LEVNINWWGTPGPGTARSSIRVTVYVCSGVSRGAGGAMPPKPKAIGTFAYHQK